MKLGSLKEGGRDGTLIVVDRELRRAVRAGNVAPSLQKALEDWPTLAPRLAELAERLRDD
jgi:fumarylacetoacetate (FAA) hydrolase